MPDKVRRNDAQGIKRDFAIEELRHIVNNFDSCRESFNTQFSLGELIKIHRAWMACDWDFYPDEWDPRQVKEVLLYGKIPQWDFATEKPLFEAAEYKYLDVPAGGFGPE